MELGNHSFQNESRLDSKNNSKTSSYGELSKEAQLERSRRTRIRDKMLNLDSDEESPNTSPRIAPATSNFFYTKFNDPLLPPVAPKSNTITQKEPDHDLKEEIKVDDEKVWEFIRTIIDQAVDELKLENALVHSEEPSPYQYDERLDDSDDSEHSNFDALSDGFSATPLRLHDELDSDKPEVEELVYVHKADTIEDQLYSFENKPNDDQDVNSEIDEGERPKVIILDDIGDLSDDSDDQHIQFHRSPKRMDEVEFIEKISEAKPKEKTVNSITDVLSNIPKDYFRKEARYESIDQVLEHITQRRDNFLAGISSSPNRSASRTIEPMLKPVSPHAQAK